MLTMKFKPNQETKKKLHNNHLPPNSELQHQDKRTHVQSSYNQKKKETEIYTLKIKKNSISVVTRNEVVLQHPNRSPNQTGLTSNSPTTTFNQLNYYLKLKKKKKRVNQDLRPQPNRTQIIQN